MDPRQKKILIVAAILLLLISSSGAGAAYYYMNMTGAEDDSDSDFSDSDSDFSDSDDDEETTTTTTPPPVVDPNANTGGNGVCEGPNKQVCNDFMRSWVFREPTPWKFTTHTESGQYAMGFPECKPCERRGFISSGSGYNVTIGNTTTYVNTPDEAMTMLEL